MKTKSLIGTVLIAMMFLCCKQTPKNQFMVLQQNWKIQQSLKVNTGGSEISKSNFQPVDWYDAHVPSTVMGILSALPEYKKLMEGGNYYTADKTKFNSSWWYRTTFNMNDLKPGNGVLLQFDGISYYSNIWLNGSLIASKDTTYGTFRRFEFNITPLVKKGENTLAVEVFKQQPGDFGLGFVDWNPRPLDTNMGIWRDVTVKTVDNIQIKNSFVRSKVNTQLLNEAWLTIGTQLKNFTQKTIEGNLCLTLEGNEMEYPVSLSAGETKPIVLTAKELNALHIKNPKLWWCNGLGEAKLYNLKLEFKERGKVKAHESVRFGIRKIESYFNSERHRGFKLNGKEILIKGAGWTDDIFLRDTKTSNDIQVKYVKDMGMNTIRFENIWGTSQNIYDLCDENGLLAIVGWSCQWEWENYLGKACDNYGGITTPTDIRLVSQYMRDQVIWLRNHPSIFVWMVGSDMLPRPAMEREYIKLFSELDNRPWLSAASTRTSELTGPTGVKMNGPYEYVGPSYWYLDKKNGGAFGFNTETGPGPQLPVIESIEKMIPTDERWPLSKAWDQHCTTSGGSMNSMKLQNEVITAQYGTPTSFEDFVRKSHLSNYEAIRAMFEAFRVNRPNSTGIIQWMLNSAWPSLYWQLYDYFLVPTPAYYGVKKALQPVQLFYDYGDRSIVLSNETLQPVEGAKAKIRVFDIDSKEVVEKTIVVNALANQSQKLFTLPDFSKTGFLKVELADSIDEIIAENFYWLSAQKEVFDWEKTEWYYSPMKSYSNYTELKKLEVVALQMTPTTSSNGDEITIKVKIRNPQTTIAFFNELKLKDGNGEIIVPAFFSDNYFSLLPDEERTIDVRFPSSALKGKKAWLSLSGWNVEKEVVEIDL